MAHNLLVLIGVAAFHVALFTGATWALLAAVGGNATEAAFGSPALIKGRIGDTAISVGPIPTGAVTILGRSTDAPVSDPRDWRRLPLGKRLAVLFAPWLVVVAIAVGCLGPARAASSIVHGFYQVLFVLDLTPLVRRLFELAATGPWSLVLGIAFAKSAAINLLPLPGLAGGGLLVELAGSRRAFWVVPGMVVMLFVSVRMIYALVRVVLG